MIDIPVLSELVKFTDPKALCLLSCTSKTLHIDLQGTKAWARLAEAQLPPPTPRDDSEARSHVWRREVAKALPHPRRVLEGVTLLEALSRETPAPFEFTRNRFTDFTYFLRLEDSGRLIWEGDLGDLSRESDEEELVLHISMRHANLRWPGRVNKIALVAIRDNDQAMVSLGRFDISQYSGLQLDGEQQYDFLPTWSLFDSPRSHLLVLPTLCVTQDGYVNRLELRPEHIAHTRMAEADDIGPCDESLFQYVLTYLAGIHNPIARAYVLARIKRCFLAEERRRGWVDYEVKRLYADTVLREQDEIEAARAEQELEDERNYDPEAECYIDEYQCGLIRELLDEAEASRAEAQLECEQYRHWDPFFTLELEHEREKAARVARVEELREQDEAEASRAEADF